MYHCAAGVSIARQLEVKWGTAHSDVVGRAHIPIMYGLLGLWPMWCAASMGMGHEAFGFRPLKNWRALRRQCSSHSMKICTGHYSGYKL